MKICAELRHIWRVVVYLLYDLILFCSALLLVPYYLIRGIRQGKVRRGIRERLSFYAAGRLDLLQGRQGVIWVHAVSVGETKAAIPLLKALKDAHPDKALVLSNVTETGHAVAQDIPEVDICLFFPFDLSWVVRRVFRQVKPSLMVIVETEIWPNFVRIARESGVPVMLVNGRISDRSYPRYLFVRRLLEPVLRQFSAFCMQTSVDAQRIRELGADPAVTSVSGNLKFDMVIEPQQKGRAEQLRQRFQLPGEALVWVAGSTHAGEEEMVADSFRYLLNHDCPCVLVLAPRHPGRCRTVRDVLEKMGFRVVLRSQVDEVDEPLQAGEILLVDTIGELVKFYALADVVFVGGSLVETGGHNILEASALAKPVVFGPHMTNFKEISSLVLNSGGGIQVADAAALSDALHSLLSDPAARKSLGEKGFALVEKNTGATRRTLDVIDGFLNT